MTLPNKRRPLIIGSEIPSTPNERDVWINTDNNLIYRYDGTTWAGVTSASAVTASAGYTFEQIQDVVAPLLNHASHTNVSVSYDDSNNKILISIPTESIQDISAGLLNHANHTNITAFYNDALNRIELSSSAGLDPATASATYLTQSNASATYATKTELNNIDLSATIQTASAAAVTYLVDSAPGTLDTLNELAAALNDDPNYATTITNSLASKLDISSASTTYLTQSSASTTYLTQSSASATYLTQSSASTQYEKLIPYSASAPSTPTEGDLWVDSTVPTIKAYIGGLWTSVGGGAVDSDQVIISGRMFA